MYNSNFDYIDQRYIDIFSMADMVNQPIHIITPDGIVRFVNQSGRSFGETYRAHSRYK